VGIKKQIPKTKSIPNLGNKKINMTKKRAHLFIEGHVQGVYFRATTKEKALEKGVKGWVKNLPDGRVEAVFEGDREKVNQLIEFCHEGPEHAEVKNIEIQEQQYQDEFQDFEIKY